MNWKELKNYLNNLKYVKYYCKIAEERIKNETEQQRLF